MIWEADYLVRCFLFGIGLMAAYDVLRIVRIVVPHNSVFMGIEDMLYWLAASVGMFYVLYIGDDGTIRWFAIGAAVLGMVLWNGIVSRFAVPVIGRVLHLPIDFAGKLLKAVKKKVKIESKVNKIKACLKRIAVRKAKRRCLHGRKAEKEKEE